MMLLFIFPAIPNGSTMDQVVFIILNGLDQVNVLTGKWLNSARCIEELEPVGKESPETRTEVYGYLVRRFKNLEVTKNGVDAMLPKTSGWKRWLNEGLKDYGRNVKDIYKDEAQRRKTSTQTSTITAYSP